MSGWQEYRLALIDILILLIIPVVIATIHFFLSDAMYNQLLFTYGDASIITIWTTVVLHTSNAHLTSNLLGYVVAIGFVYSLYRAEIRDRQRFWITVATLLLVVPPITKFVDYVMLYQHAGLLADEATSRGFSGIVSAFGGMLLATIGHFTAGEYGKEAGVQVVLLIFLIGLGLLMAANGILTLEVAGAIIIALALGSTLFVSRTDLQQPGHLRYRITDNRKNLAQIVGYGAVVCLFLYSIIPINPVQSGIFVNVLAHAVGFFSGVGTQAVIFYMHVSSNVTRISV
jgi:hypothetical protein